ncbi:uncharacterized protein LOC62_01G000995 [Vanrija pseudolonga]|uniref:Uncharacterized protein n=1 Tax=Vanrija pseudolonga TaxID=143232 RepID=A0AAF0Y4B8_9TREE|nr:hypothetical protein LOC62_01G000995 [Vanrija pseudolonga]
MAPFTPSGRTIPFELLDLVISNYTPEDGPTLARVAGTCRAAHDLAIPILYSHIHLHSDRQLERLYQNLSVTDPLDPAPSPECEVAVPMIKYWEPEEPTGVGARKLLNLSKARYITLHYIPSLEAASSLDNAVIQVLGPPPFGIRRAQLTTLNDVQGVCLGAGFVRRLCEIATSDNDSPRDDSSLSVEENYSPSESQHEYPFNSGRNGTPESLQGLRKLSRRLYDTPQRCWNLDDLPDGMSNELKLKVKGIWAYSRLWGGYSYCFNSHSTFPGASLSPWTTTMAQWRHYIHVDMDAPLPTSDLVIDGQVMERLPDDDMLDALALDIYSISLDLFSTIVWGDKPRRRDFILSGISVQQVRELEQKFVALVRDEFDYSHRLIVKPIKGYEVDPDGNDGEDLRYNRCGPGDRDYAVREHQKRVLMFDFYHASEMRRCLTCGKGGEKENIEHTEEWLGFGCR